MQQSHAHTSNGRTGEDLQGNWVARLQQFVRGGGTAAAPAQGEAEECDLCGQPIAASHPHLVEPAAHRLLCVCKGCDMLLGDREDRKYARVPEEARRLFDFRLADAEWDALGIPIGLAFFFHSTPEGRVLALYPGPAGPTESLLPLEAWDGIVNRNPVLGELEPDVEALLVNRTGTQAAYYAVPIDRCYELVGLIRTHWEGVSGGARAWSAIGDFFASLRAPKRPAGAVGHG